MKTCFIYLWLKRLRQGMSTVSEQYKLEQENKRLKEKADMYDQANINQQSMTDDLLDLVKENRKLKEELDTKESKE